MEPSVSPTRWQQAQAYEANWWRTNAGGYNTRYLRTLADVVERAVRPILECGPAVSAIEVGAGPVGIVPFLNVGRRVATDPLDGVFEETPLYRELREAAREDGTEYVAAMGEDLPFEDGTFDLYVTDNVLDHMQSPQRALAEAHRVLRPGGAAYVRVHVYHGWGRAVRRVMEVAQIDHGHPHSLSTDSLRALAEGEGFHVVHSSRSSYSERWIADVKRGVTGVPKALVQAALGVTRADFELVLRQHAD